MRAAAPCGGDHEAALRCTVSSPSSPSPPSPPAPALVSPGVEAVRPPSRCRWLPAAAATEGLVADREEGLRPPPTRDDPSPPKLPLPCDAGLPPLRAERATDPLSPPVLSRVRRGSDGAGLLKAVAKDSVAELAAAPEPSAAGPRWARISSWSAPSPSPSAACSQGDRSSTHYAAPCACVFGNISWPPAQASHGMKRVKAMACCSSVSPAGRPTSRPQASPWQPSPR